MPQIKWPKLSDIDKHSFGMGIVITALGIVPGAGHILLRRWSAALILAIIGVLFAFLGFRFNLAAPILLLGITSAISVALCAYEVQPEPSDMDHHSAVRHKIERGALLAAAMIFVGHIALITAMQTIGWRAASISLTSNSAGRFVFLPYDELLIDENISVDQIKRDQIVTYGDSTDNEQFGVVIAKSGDSVEARNGRIFIDGKLYDSNIINRFPLNKNLNQPPEPIAKGCVALFPAYSWKESAFQNSVWRSLSLSIDSNKPYTTANSIQGRVMATDFPRLWIY